MRLKIILKKHGLIVFLVMSLLSVLLVTFTIGNRSGEIILAICLISWATHHYISRRRKLRAIRSVLSEYQGGNFIAKVINIENSDKSPLDVLAFQINSLGEQLERLKSTLKVDYTEELEKADRLASVGELAASVAHEIRNPVAGIANAIQVLSSEMQDSDENRLIISEIQKQAQRVNRAINNLLHYTRPAPLDLVPCELNFPIDGVMVLLDGRIRENRIKLNMQLVASPPNVLIDVQQIQQVFVNLILNAIQAMPNGGILTLETFSDEEHVELLITDSGDGIPDDVSPYIFRPFFTTKHQGTGLGLSISRKIIEEHSGSIELDSSRSKGTGFRIRLPIYKSKRK